MKTLGSGRHYRVSGANRQTGEDVEITVEAYDEADAARAANRQGVFVSSCVSADADGSGWAASAPKPAAPPDDVPAGAVPKFTFAETVARDPVVQKLVRVHPELAPRVRRLNEDDQLRLLDLAGERLGISFRDSAYVARLVNEAKAYG
jgi:hypothetical protein